MWRVERFGILVSKGQGIGLFSVARMKGNDRTREMTNVMIIKIRVQRFFGVLSLEKNATLSSEPYKVQRKMLSS